MPQSERQKAAWNIVHGIYRNPPVSAENKKRAWDTLRAAYSKNPILNPMTKDSKTRTLMREEIPEREEDMTVKPISATAPPAGVSSAGDKPEESKRKALYSLGQWAWRRFGGNEIKPVFHSVSSGVAHFYVKNVDKLFSGYWPEWAPIISTPIRYAGGQVMIRRDGTIAVSVPLKRLEAIYTDDTTEQKAYNWFERAFGWSIMNNNGNVTLESAR